MTTDHRSIEAATTLYVCVTCRNQTDPDEARAGRRLYDALAGALTPDALTPDPNIALVPVECLSVCRRPCTVSFASPGKWTYVYGDLPAETAAAVILEGARLYAAAPDGLIPWRARPLPLRSGVVARVPPLSGLPPSGPPLAVPPLSGLPPSGPPLPGVAMPQEGEAA